MTKLRMFVSAGGGVGKTSIVWNLAMQLTQMGQTVLCLDADPAGGLLCLKEKEPDLPDTIWQHLQLIPFHQAPTAIDAFDWVLIDSPSGLPNILPDNIRLVVCTDASFYGLSRLEHYLDELMRLREKNNFSLHKLLLTRVKAGSPVHWKNVQQLRNEGGRSRIYDTVLWEDADIHHRAQTGLTAPHGGFFHQLIGRLALEWIQEPFMFFPPSSAPRSKLWTLVDALQSSPSQPRLSASDTPESNLPIPPTSFAVETTTTKTRQEHLDAVLRSSLQRGGFSGIALSDASGMLFSAHTSMDHAQLSGLAALLVGTLERVERVSGEFRPDTLALDISFTDKMVLRRFWVGNTVMCLIVFALQESDVYDEIELTVAEIVSILKS